MLIHYLFILLIQLYLFSYISNQDNKIIAHFESYKSELNSLSHYLNSSNPTNSTNSTDILLDDVVDYQSFIFNIKLTNQKIPTGSLLYNPTNTSIKFITKTSVYFITPNVLLGKIKGSFNYVYVSSSTGKFEAIIETKNFHLWQNYTINDTTHVLNEDFYVKLEIDNLNFTVNLFRDNGDSFSDQTLKDYNGSQYERAKIRTT